MSSTAETAHVREARRLCREFTLDLYLRRGAFWEAVQEFRFSIHNSQYRYDVYAWSAEGGYCAELECSGCIKCTPHRFLKICRWLFHLPLWTPSLRG